MKSLISSYGGEDRGVGTVGVASNKAVTWKSSNKKVATVNSKSIVTLKKNSRGKKVTVTATAKDGSNK